MTIDDVKIIKPGILGLLFIDFDSYKELQKYC